MKSKRVVAWFCCLVLAGCADLGAVKDISTRLAASSRSWDDVSGDIAGSCQRERVLNPALIDCQLEDKASKGLMAADRVLTEYFSALFAAANESNFTVKPGLDALTGSVGSIPGIDQAQVKAASGLISLIAKLATEQMREETLRDLIGNGGPAAQTLVDGLSQLVVPRLKARLSSERTQLAGYFAQAILAQRDAIGDDVDAICAGSQASRFSAVGFLLTQEYCQRVAVVAKRQQALDDYGASLSSASKALVELQSSSAQLKAKDVIRKLYEIGRELDDSLAVVRKAFA